MLTNHINLRHDDSCECFCIIIHMYFRLSVAFGVGNNFFHWQNTGAALQVITTHSKSLLNLRVRS